MKIYRMGRYNNKYLIWLDIKLGRYWYVFQWIKWRKPFLYRSTDGTPPEHDKPNDGKMLFGRYSD